MRAGGGQRLVAPAQAARLREGPAGGDFRGRFAGRHRLEHHREPDHGGHPRQHRESCSTCQAFGVGGGDRRTFGTGYSSLAYLARLPVETLKIDPLPSSSRCSTIRIPPPGADDDHAGPFVRLKVGRKEVETEEQAKMLRLLRCDQMQGYLFSKPVPRDAITAMLQK